jgi:Spy/CpxP family protein refolding chaperone
MNTSKHLAVTLAFGAFVAFAAFVSAAEADRDPARRPGAPGEPGRIQRPFQGQGRPGGVPFETILTREQRMELREEFISQREKMRELEEKSGPLRRELEEALFAEKLDETVVREKSAALAALETERSLIRARMFAKIRPSLSEEQLERLRDLRADGARGPRMGDGEFRRFRDGGPGAGPGPDDRPQRPRGPRPPGDESEFDVLPPPAPPRPPGPAPR